MVFPLRGADDVFRLFLTRVVPQRNQKDEIVQWFGTNTDIDDAKRIETELRRSAQRAKFLAQASADFAELTDDQSTMQKIASMAVPDFADWCAVDLAQPEGALPAFGRQAYRFGESAVWSFVDFWRDYPPQPDDLRTGFMPFFAPDRRKCLRKYRIRCWSKARSTMSICKY